MNSPFINCHCQSRWRVILSWLVCLGAVSLPFLATTQVTWAQTPSGYELLGRGVNYGNMLEAPREGEWGVRFDDKFPELVKAAGFDSVRVPVRWSAATSTEAPFQIDPKYIARVKHVVDLNLDQGLKVVLNMHHFEELYESPESQRERFLAIWRQIAEAFEGADDRLFFEILNEPHGNLDAEQWNPLVVEALAEIRKLHPDRWVVVGPDQWNAVARLPELQLPQNDRRLIVTVHYYLPFDFTHQGANWVSPQRPTGVTWSATPAQREEIDRDMQQVADWAKEKSRPVYVGEFGAYEAADLKSRATWTAYVREACEKRDFAWAYWELAAGFGILDKSSYEWKKELVGALIPR